MEALGIQEISISVIGTGSSGNGYILSCGNDKLIVDCGMPFESVLYALDYDITSVCGVLVTHAHGDHAKHIVGYSEFFPIYTCRSVADKYGCCKCIKPKSRVRVGAFEVIPLPVPHGDCENYAYYIYHKGCGYTLFCTDAEYFPYKSLKPLPSHIIIECNYVHSKIIERLDRGEEIRSDYKSHMEVTDSIDAVKRLRSSNLQNVVLIHKSSGNFDKEKVLSMFADELQIVPIIANKNSLINLCVYDF